MTAFHNPDGSLQMLQTVQAATTQSAFLQMAGELSSWNPELPQTIAEKFIQNSYRRILDERQWYGLLAKGVLPVPALYTGGTVLVTNGSASVTGQSTSWTDDLEGRQFRIAFGMPTYTIKMVDSPTQLTLDLPWANQGMGPVPYQVFQQLVSFGANIKMLKAVLNQQMGWRCKVNVPREWVDAFDTWRTNMNWVRLVLGAQPAADGTPLWELYPVPVAQQALPFLAYVQPPDLSEDNPFPVSFIRSDLIVTGALPDALLFRGKTGRYYDPMTANAKRQEFQYELRKLAAADEAYDLKSFTFDFDRAPAASGGPDYAQEHDYEAD